MPGKRFLRPDSAARSVMDVDFPAFYKKGFRLVLLDLDNTLSAHGSHLPDDFARQVIRVIRMAGLTPALVSNAKKKRALSFARALDIPAVPLAGKPFARKIRALILRLGHTQQETLLIGDQIFTDVLAARNAGIYAVLVLPRFQEETWNVRLKRWFERPFIHKDDFG